MQQHSDLPFIFAGNRDELHARRTSPAHWWQDAPDVFGGRDKEAGGAWLGLRRDGRFAVITNYRDPHNLKSDAPSRGKLVHAFLSRDVNAEDYLQELAETGPDYNGFTLLFGDTQALWCYSNAATENPSSPITAGLHGLSNHLLDTPWPKVTRSRNRLQQLIEAGADSDNMIDGALELLADSEPAPDAELPDTGVEHDIEKLLSAPKIVSPRYGTRASTVLVMNRQGEVDFVERSFAADGSINGEVRKRIELRRTP